MKDIFSEYFEMILELIVISMFIRIISFMNELIIK